LRSATPFRVTGVEIVTTDTSSIYATTGFSIAESIR
jgi:hypothetical protein